MSFVCFETWHWNFVVSSMRALCQIFLVGQIPPTSSPLPSHYLSFLSPLQLEVGPLNTVRETGGVL